MHMQVIQCSLNYQKIDLSASVCLYEYLAVNAGVTVQFISVYRNVALCFNYKCEKNE